MGLVTVSERGGTDLTTTKNGEIHHNPVDGIVLVRGNERILKVFLINLPELKLKATTTHTYLSMIL